MQPFWTLLFHRSDLVNGLYRALHWRRHLNYLTGSIMTVKNGLYSIRIEMKDGGRGRATGVIVLFDGQILGATRISIIQAPIPSKTASGVVSSLPVNMPKLSA
jgi:hypothetical protein